MSPFDTIVQLELKAWHLAAPYVGAIVAYIGAISVVAWAQNVAAGIAFRRRGFKLNHPIRVDGLLCKITRVGLASTTFQVLETNPVERKKHHYDEYLEVVNSRLKFLSIRRLVPKLDGV